MTQLALETVKIHPSIRVNSVSQVLIQNLKSDKTSGKQRSSPLSFSRKNIFSLHMKPLRLGRVIIFSRSHAWLGQEPGLPLAFQFSLRQHSCAFFRKQPLPSKSVEYSAVKIDNSIVFTPLRYLGHLRLRLIKTPELCLQTSGKEAEVDTIYPEKDRCTLKREGRKCNKQCNSHVTTKERS